MGRGVEEREREIWESRLLKKFPNTFFYDFEEIKPVKFTRDSNRLARYDFLVIREGYHVRSFTHF